MFYLHPLLKKLLIFFELALLWSLLTRLTLAINILILSIIGILELGFLIRKNTLKH